MKKEISVTKKDLLGESFCNSTYAVDYPNFPGRSLDEDGVLIFKIPYGDKYEYYPIHLARYGLGNLEKYIETNNRKYLDVFYTQAKWLYNNISERDGFAVWEHYYKLPYYKFDHVPWVHGLGQILGMMVLLKTYQLDKDKSYLEKAEQVLFSFNVKIEDGGVKHIDDSNNVWYEEYALLPPPNVLNGFITILFGLDEFNRVTGSKLAKDLFDKGISTLENNIEFFDAGFWSYYDLLRKLPSTVNYHKMHIWQLRRLYDMTNVEVFKKKSSQWQSMYDNKFNHVKAKVKRNLFFLKQYGILGSIKRFNRRRNWKKNVVLQNK